MRTIWKIRYGIWNATTQKNTKPAGLYLQASPHRPWAKLMKDRVMPHPGHGTPVIRKNVQEALNGYVALDAILNEIDSFIVPPALGNRAGVLGAIALAREAMKP